jgi:hypothetical protein
MKKIELKVSKEEINGQKMVFTTYDLLVVAINKPVEGGFNVEEMRKRIRLLNELDKHKDLFKGTEKIKPEDSVEKFPKANFELEDADYDNLKELVHGTKWGLVSRTILELCEEFK